MDNVLARKLELFGPLQDADKRLLQTIVRAPRRVASHQDLIRQGDSPSDVHLILEGVCCRSKVLSSGRRQIFGYLLPGDFCDLHVFLLKAMDHDITTLASSRIVDISRFDILELCKRPRIARALWWATLVDEAILREWVVNLGQRDAEQRIAHLFCELHVRMQSVGLTTNGAFELPLTQAELAETVGMSAVHANRCIQVLRARGLMEFKSRAVNIPDVRQLEAFAEFDPAYLHLEIGKYDGQD